MLAAATDPARPAIVVIEPGQDALALVSEALALLPPDERWSVTFSTYFLGTMAGVRCEWRFVPNDAPDLPKWIAASQAVVIRADRPADEVPDGPLVEAARTGIAPVAERRTVTTTSAGVSKPRRGPDYSAGSPRARRSKLRRRAGCGPVRALH